MNVRGGHHPRVIWRRARHRATLAMRARGREVPTDPVFVVSAARTGSTLLVDLLRSLPGVSFENEILNPDVRVGLRQARISWRSVRRHLRHSIATQSGRVRGAKLLLNQIYWRGIGAPELTSVFPDARFVVLYRRSLADQFVSGLLARKSGVFQDRSGAGRTDVGAIDIEPEAAREYLAINRRFYEWFLESKATKGRTLLVCYEDLGADPNRVVSEQICPFLGLEPAPVATALKKQVRRPIEELVVNWDDVAPILTGPAATLDL